MAFNEIPFKQEENSVDRIFDERGNMILAMRKIAWGANSENFKLELRKWKLDGESEIPNKGFSFLTENGPTELVHCLVEEGFGETKHILNTVKDRDDFKKSLNIVMGKESEFFDDTISIDEEESFYDPALLDLD